MNGRWNKNLLDHYNFQEIIDLQCHIDDVTSWMAPWWIVPRVGANENGSRNVCLDVASYIGTMGTMMRQFQYCRLQYCRLKTSQKSLITKIIVEWVSRRTLNSHRLTKSSRDSDTWLLIFLQLSDVHTMVSSGSPPDIAIMWKIHVRRVQCWVRVFSHQYFQIRSY